MKIKSALVAILLITGLAPGVAQATERPVVESFTFTPNDLDLISANTNVVFELVVSHPSGIKNISTLLTLTGPNGSSLATYLTRTDSPINLALSKVTFVFAAIKSRSFGVKVRDSTRGRTLAWATPGAKPVINKMATSADLIFNFSPLVIPNLIMDILINAVLWRRMRDLNPR